MFFFLADWRLIRSFLGHISFHVISDEIVNLNEAIDLLVVTNWIICFFGIKLMNFIGITWMNFLKKVLLKGLQFF